MEEYMKLLLILILNFTLQVYGVGWDDGGKSVLKCPSGTQNAGFPQWNELLFELKKEIFGHFQVMELKSSHYDPEVFCKNLLYLSRIDETTAKSSGSKIHTLDFRMMSHNRQMRDGKLQQLLKVCSNLRKLRLFDCSFFHCVNIEDITQLKYLIYLELPFYPMLAGLTLKPIEKLSNLTTLKLGGNGAIKGSDLRYLTQLTKLTSLNLNYCSKVTDLDLVCIKTLKNLTSLDLTYCTKLTGAALKQVGKFLNLNYLNLSSCKIQDFDLAQLSRLSKLKRIEFTHCQDINDTVVDYLPYDSMTYWTLENFYLRRVAYRKKRLTQEFSQSWIAALDEVRDKILNSFGNENF